MKIPETHLRWNLYGQGLTSFGVDGKPERVATPQPAPDQLLVRVDSVSICYSDVKLLNQGGTHPKLKNRDLISDPTRPGHEVGFTVEVVGEELGEEYHPGDRFAIQPEVVLDGKKQTYGFSIPGGLTQYQLIGPELLDTDRGASIIRIAPEFGYAESSLLEPQGSVLASYTRERRLTPKEGGVMWIIGNPEEETADQFSRFLNRPALVLVTSLSEELQTLVMSQNQQVRDISEIDWIDVESRIRKETAGKGVDDIVVLNPRSASKIQSLVNLVNQGGLINLVGNQPIGAEVTIDPQRIHYHFVGLVGSSSRDIANAYGTDRNRSDLLSGGTILLIGGGGPMGQMHLQRAINMENGPAAILITELNQDRIDFIQSRYIGIAQQAGKQIQILDPSDPEFDLQKALIKLNGNPVADDVVVLVPTEEALTQAVSVMHADSLINIFAGTPEGLEMKVDLSLLFLGNAQFTGASGLEIEHIQAVYQSAWVDVLDLNISVAAVGGMNSAAEAIRAVGERRCPGKIVIYPQVEELPLTELNNMSEVFPEVAENLGPGQVWTTEAERVLLRTAS